jgi:peptide deformylase
MRRSLAGDTLLNIIHYPHLTLRHRAQPLKKVDKFIRDAIKEMFELMYEARGIGLAANQVDLPFQLFVINPEGEPDSGQEQVFINPVLSAPKGQARGEEGCLSLPGIYAPVARPEQIHVSGYDLQGNAHDFLASGTLARVIQHEFDHLQGVLFIDRLTPADRKLIEPDLAEFELELQQLRAAKLIPSEEDIRARWESLENQYC